MSTTPSSFQPPPGYLRVDSALDGVQVWAPAPEEEDDRHERRSFKCPSCGAPIGFDEGEGSLACPYCGFTEQPLGPKVGRAADAQEFTVEAMEVFRGGEGLGVERRELHCETCGADLAVEEGSISASCPFCASAAVHIRESTHHVQRPSHVLPFKLDRAAVNEAARAWLGDGWMQPGDLGEVASVERSVGIYLPWWTFSATLSSSWNAEVGYERRERYYDSSSGSWKTRTVIDWRWESGYVSVPIYDHLVAAVTQISARLLREGGDFDLSDLAEYDPGYLAGWQAQSYQIDLLGGWELARGAMRVQAKDACYANVPTNHVRSFSMSADFQEESWRYVLLPVYISAFHYGGEVFQVLINGQTGTVVGRKPVAWWKIWLIIALMFSPTVFLGLLGLVLLIFGVGIVPLILAFVCLVPAIGASIWLHGKARAQVAE